MKIFNGSPADTHRMEKEYRTYRLLDDLNISFERVDHEATASVESCEEIDQVLDIEICKNLFLCNTQKTKYYLLVMPGSKRFETKKLSKQLEIARLSFGKPDDMERILDITPGSVSILGLMNDTEQRIQLLIDSDIKKEEYFGCHPCINTSSLKIKTQDILEKFLPHTKHQPIYVDL